MTIIRGWLQQNSVLSWSIALQLALACFALAAMPFDKRTILGVNPWIKPLKFDLSVGILMCTLALILSGLQGYDRARQMIGAGLGIALSLENCIISLQSFRGVRSHMNYATPFDAHLFACMDLLFVLSISLLVWLLGTCAQARDPRQTAAGA